MLLTHKNINNFCVLMLFPVTLSKHFSTYFGDFFTQSVITYEYSYKFFIHALY